MTGATHFADNTLLGGVLGDAEIAGFFTPEAEIAAIIAFEAALARGEAAEGVIPVGAGAAITEALNGVSIDPEELIEPTRAAGVVVPGLVKLLRERAGPDGAYIHWGATTQDAMDTGLIMRLRDALAVLEDRLRRLIDGLTVHARDHARLPMAGRTRSQIATPVTFGLRVAAWRAPLVRCLDRLQDLRPRLLVAQLGGASGTLSVLGDKGPAVLQRVARDLGLGCPAKTWQTERDGLVELANWLSMISGLVGRIGADLMLMGRSEIGEARAGVGGGSSTMPHKANPVLAEALITLARFNAGQCGLAQSALLHTEERDGPAWSGEWLVLPQMTVAAGAGLAHALELAGSLTPDARRMAVNMDIADGAIHAEALAFALAVHMPLSDAQAIVKQAAKTDGGTLSERVAVIAGARGVPAPELGDLDVSALAEMWILRSLDGV